MTNEALVCRAPWTDDQVASLQGFQREGYWHQFTCGNKLPPRPDHPYDLDPRWGRRCGEDLVAEADGWHCPNEADHLESGRQDWAWRWMADWSWRRITEAMQRRLDQDREEESSETDQ